MKRKELQSLCKKHSIPANLSNLNMAKMLSELFKVTHFVSVYVHACVASVLMIFRVLMYFTFLGSINLNLLSELECDYFLFNSGKRKAFD